MRRLNIRTILIGLIFLASYANAQEMNIPRASPKAGVSLMIGVNKISVAYASPSARGREIIGNIVPYGKVWRAGANEATTITFEKSAFFQGVEIPMGTYGLFMIPSEGNWTVILNRIGIQWGAYHYDMKEDLLRVEIAPEKVSYTESCTFSFDNISKSEATLYLQWENIGIPMVISTNTKKQTLEEIRTHLNSSKQDWFNYSAAAQYHFYELREFNKAIEYIDKAIELKAKNPAPWMLKSQILAEQKKYVGAIESAKEAILISKEYNFYFEIEENETQIEKWEKLLKKK